MDKRNAFLLAMYYTGWFASDIGPKQRARFITGLGGLGHLKDEVNGWVEELYEWFDEEDVTAADLRNWIKGQVELALTLMDEYMEETIEEESKHGQA